MHITLTPFMPYLVVYIAFLTFTHPIVPSNSIYTGIMDIGFLPCLGFGTDLAHIPFPLFTHPSTSCPYYPATPRWDTPSFPTHHGFYTPRTPPYHCVLLPHTMPLGANSFLCSHGTVGIGPQLPPPPHWVPLPHCTAFPWTTPHPGWIIPAYSPFIGFFGFYLPPFPHAFPTHYPPAFWLTPFPAHLF